MAMELTSGAVAAIWKDAAAVSASGVPLVLQLVELQPWLEAPGPGWHSMILSDGDHFIAGALPPDRPASRAVLSTREGAVISFLRFECRTAVDKRVIVPIQVQVLQTEWVTIGNPKLYQSTKLEGKHEELDIQSESTSSERNTGTYSAGQGVKTLLTRGILMMLQQPVLQVVSVTRSRQEILEFHLVLSDGVHTRNATLASHLNHLVKNSHLQMGTIVRLLEFTCSTVQSHSLISVVQLEVLQTECELIGRPKAYEPCCIGKPCELQTKRSEPYHGLVPNYTKPENAPHSSDQGFKWLLTEGAVVAMLEGKMAVEQKPVMQVVDVSLASKTKLFPMYRVLLSDGVYQEHALLHPDRAPLVEDFLLCNGSIVRILKLECDTSMNYRIFVVKLEVILMKCELIGSPTFHPLGLKHKELYANPAANVPWLPEKNPANPRVLALLDEPAKSSFRSYPGYKSRPS